MWRIPPAERGCNDRRHAESEQRFAVHKVGIEIVSGRGARRDDVLKKAAPFVKIYDEHGVGPFRSSGHGLESFVKEEISFADIGVRMIVVARTVIQDGVSRVNERDRW